MRPAFSMRCEDMIECFRPRWSSGRPNDHGAVLLLYDMIMTPLLLMPVHMHSAFRFMSQVITVYWTLDMMRSFITGFETRKGIEMRHRQVAIAYMRSWFLLDFLIVGMDWARFFLGVGDTVNSIGRANRYIRAWKIVQVFRLVRVVKVMKRAREKVEAMFSLGALLLLRSLLFIVAFLFVCHFMACYWYDLANPTDIESGLVQLPTTWLVQADMVDSPAAEVYAVSFLWALSQSNFASSNIYASNWMESSFTTICGFAWLVLLAMTIAYSSFWVQQYHESHKAYREQLAQIKLFLEEHQVSRGLSYKVLRSFRWNFRLYNSRVHEDDVGYFRDLPKPMIGALRAEIHTPALRGHPFFCAVAAACGSDSVQAISHVAMREQHYSGGSNVFTEGLPAHHMFFVAQGDLEYYAVKLNMEARTLAQSDWAVEPALWMRWIFNGRLVSSTSSEVVTVEVIKVHAIAKTFGSGCGGIQILRKFAQEVVSHFRDAAPGTDLWWDRSVIEQIAWRVGARTTDAAPAEQPEGFSPLARLRKTFRFPREVPC
ncbi:unnamed protein product [Prorocentrum cordatum]|uniref:Cyclic nucleotide-binding domain-containing protein n=1 Tax=Prorocentrum cordatum TaxID=2364126 RepID=A0ABN9WU82_9DINO|nr:unnamed protein product [Polarella glacialis]